MLELLLHQDKVSHTGYRNRWSHHHIYQHNHEQAISSNIINIKITFIINIRVIILIIIIMIIIIVVLMILLILLILLILIIITINIIVIIIIRHFKRGPPSTTHIVLLPF